MSAAAPTGDTSAAAFTMLIEATPRADARPSGVILARDWAALQARIARALRVLPHPLMWPTLLILALYGLAYLRFAGALVAFPFDWDQGEGYDAWSAWLVDQGRWPYTSNAAFPYYSSNYPPLWSYLVSIVMPWAGAGVGSARAVSTVAALVATFVVGDAARRRAGCAVAGVLAAGLFIGSPYVFHATPLARVNGTAVLFSLLALSLFEKPTRFRLVIGSVALLAALFTKQTTADAAVACIAFLAITRPRQGLLVAAGLLAAGLLGLAGLILLTGGAFWTNVVLGNANPFDLAQLGVYFANFTLLHAVILGLAVAEVVAAVRRRAWSPWVLYLPAALVASLAVGKWGAGESYFLGAIGVACVLGAARFVKLVQEVTKVRASGIVPWAWAAYLVLLVQALVLSHGMISEGLPWLPDMGFQAEQLGHAPTPADRAAGEGIIALLRRAPGPVLVEDPSFAVAAGKDVVGNATQLRNLYHAGLWDPAPMVDDVQAHRFSLVILDAQLYPEPVLQAIGRAYYEARTVRVNGSTYHVFLPGAD